MFNEQQKETKKQIFRGSTRQCRRCNIFEVMFLGNTWRQLFSLYACKEDYLYLQKVVGLLEKQSYNSEYIGLYLSTNFVVYCLLCARKI